MKNEFKRVMLIEKSISEVSVDAFRFFANATNDELTNCHYRIVSHPYVMATQDDKAEGK